MAEPAGRLGATPQTDGSARFEVWAPTASGVDVVLDDGRVESLQRDGRSRTWIGVVESVGHGDRYRYRVDGELLPDPASEWQPDGVHGPSAVVDTGRFSWNDRRWRGVALADTVLYELHVGTFTPEGTFDGVIGQLPRLAELGVTTIELMPVNAFPGRRNWGYDGVFPSAVQESYGGPEGLARLVEAAHGAGLAVVLDVVANHLGPEGAAHARYGPYFTETFRTPWGAGLNFSEAGSDLVRRSFIECAVRWISDYHVDGLRLDAIDRINDPTAVPFIEQLIGAVHAAGSAAGRTALTFVESAANDPANVRSPSRGGLGSDAAWNDDVHHALRVALTGERRLYYADYDGVPDLAHAFEHRWVYTGRYSPYRDRHHGRRTDDVDHRRYVVFSSNHDHVGNTPDGARPPFDGRRRLVAAAAVVLGPYTPLLFMGEEYGESRPFPYFVDHSDPELRVAVREGRRREFEGDEWDTCVLDPLDPATFEAAVLDPSVATEQPHRSILAAYTELLALRRAHAMLHDPAAEQVVTRVEDTIVVERRLGDLRSCLVLHFGDGPVQFDLGQLDGEERWRAADGPGPTAVLLIDA